MDEIMMTFPMERGAAAPHGEPARSETLLALAAAMDRTHVFRKGQLVRWKLGLRNRATPAYGEFAVVREVLAAAVHDTADAQQTSANPYFREPLTMIVGVLDPEGDLLEYYVDSRRLEPAEN